MKDIIKHLKLRQDGGHQTVLVLGSRIGGLFRSDYLNVTLMKFSNRDFSGLSKMEQFAECYRTLTRPELFSAKEIDDILKDSLEDTDIVDTDIYLASLVDMNLFDIVVTTNMDTLLEKALEYVGMKEMYDFTVYRLGEEGGKEQEILSMHRRRCQVIKLFGQLVNNDYKVDRVDYWHKRQSFENQLKMILDRDVMAIGLDPLWDAELYRVFPLQGEQSLWFINEDVPDVNNPVISAMNKNRNARYLVGNEEEYYNYCIYTLYREFISSLPVTPVGTRLILGELRRLREEVKKLREELRKDRPFMRR